MELTPFIPENSSTKRLLRNMADHSCQNEALHKKYFHNRLQFSLSHNDGANATL